MEQQDQALQRALEFYSGLGGLHYGLKLSGWHGDVVQAFDINTNANDLYRRNFKQKVNQVRTLWRVRSIIISMK